MKKPKKKTGAKSPTLSLVAKPAAEPSAFETSLTALLKGATIEDFRVLAYAGRVAADRLDAAKKPKKRRTPALYDLDNAVGCLVAGRETLAKLVACAVANFNAVEDDAAETIIQHAQSTFDNLDGGIREAKAAIMLLEEADELDRAKASA